MAEETKTTAAAPEAAASVNREELEQKILKQVEFYFSDSNLPFDKFLNKLLQENDGWAPISVIASFKRMKALTDDLSIVVSALRKSPQLLRVSEDGTKVQRAIPLPDDYNPQPASIYAKGFPENSTLEEIQEYFNKISPVKCVRMRFYKGKEKKFKGSVFVEFTSEEEAKRVAEMTLPAPGGAPGQNLLVLHKPVYLQRKKEEREQKRAEERKANEGQQPQGKGKKRKADEAVEEGAGEQEGEEEAEDAITPDLLIALDKIPEAATREDIKQFLTAVGCQIAFVDHTKGQTSAIVRLQPPEKKEGEEVKSGAGEGEAKAEENKFVSASAAVKALVEAKAELCGVVPELRALTGEEEKAYWDKIKERQAAARNRGGKNKKGRRGGRGGFKQRKTG